jgi:hypothetical protein
MLASWFAYIGIQVGSRFMLREEVREAIFPEVVI